MTDNLVNKIALVTGGGSGIGQATSMAFAREGAKVVVADVNEKGGQETVCTVAKEGGEAVFVSADVSKSVEVEAMVDQCVSTYGRLDCAFNNAGIVGALSQSSTHEYPEDVWSNVIDVNLKGVWLCMKYEIKQMLRQGSGAIVNCSSVAGLTGVGTSAYTASKHGIMGLTKTAALEYAQKGIRVNAVCPSAIRTPMIESFLEGDPTKEAASASMIPMGRIASPDEVAKAVVWLCSDAASFVTGIAMPVDGGFVAQ